MPLPPRTGQSHSTRVAAGIDPHNGGNAQRFYPVTSHLRLPPSPLCLVLVLALPCIASPRTCHLPPAKFHMCTNKAGCQAVWTRLRVSAICLPGLSFGIIVLRKAVPRYSLPINLSINADNRFLNQLADPK